MPRNLSKTRCNHCRAFGHMKKECPLLKPTETAHIGSLTEEPNKPSTSHKKTQESSEKDGFKVLILTDQDPALAHLHMCDLCDEYGHYEYDCELFIKAKKDQEDYAKNWRERLAEKITHNKHCNTDEHDDMECTKDEMMAMFYTCHYCDKEGHFEHNCPSFLKEAKKQDDYDKNWRKRWGKKIVENKKRLESMPKSSKSGMQCDYCYSVHHDTSDCFLSIYGVKEDLKL